MKEAAEIGTWVQIAAVVFLFVCAGIGYHIGYGEGRDRAIRDNAQSKLSIGVNG